MIILKINWNKFYNNKNNNNNTDRSPNLSQTTRLSDSQQKKENLPNSGLYHSG